MRPCRLAVIAGAAISAVACDTPPGLPLPQLYPDVLGDSATHWFDREGVLPGRCYVQAERTHVVVLDDVSGPCGRPLRGCIRDWIGEGPDPDSVPVIYALSNLADTELDPDEEWVARHELGHLWYACRDQTADRDHERRYFPNP